MMPRKMRDPRLQIALDLRKARDLLNSSLTATITETEEFPTSSREYPDTMWDSLQWLGNKVCQVDVNTGEMVLDQVKAKEVAMILTGDNEAESDAWVADMVVAMEQYHKMYGDGGYIPTPFPF